MTLNRVPLFISEDHLAFYFSKFRDVSDVLTIKSKEIQNQNPKREIIKSTDSSTENNEICKNIGEWMEVVKKASKVTNTFFRQQQNEKPQLEREDQQKQKQQQGEGTKIQWR